MEINITAFFSDADPRDYSASVAEIGQHAARDTWRAACEAAPDYQLLNTEEERAAFRDHVQRFGAWEPEEVAAWTSVELTALFIQMIAGDMRDAGGEPGAAYDWDDYEARAAAGEINGRMFKGTDGAIYYYIGE